MKKTGIVLQCVVLVVVAVDVVLQGTALEYFSVSSKKTAPESRVVTLFKQTSTWSRLIVVVNDSCPLVTTCDMSFNLSSCHVLVQLAW